ncbi:hypothetical protein ABW19_dt0210340 [Dactylella cylindrospora]|nr:hypothetical protein ABW19_dt0210340 [Dactylella cylindrospora]
MAEVAGLTIGVIGLAGLFSACIDSFDTITLGKSFARDHEVLMVRLEVEKTRLLIWGKSVGLVAKSGTGTRPADPESASAVGLDISQNCDKRLESPLIRPTVERLLNCIKMLFEDARELRKRYGLRLGVSGNVLANLVASIHIGASGTRASNSNANTSRASIFRETYYEFESRLLRTQRRTASRNKVRWAIADQKKFSQLVEDLKKLVDGLLGLPALVDLLVEQEAELVQEIRAINNVESLRLLQEACSMTHQSLSEVASVHLLDIEHRRGVESISENSAVSASAAPEAVYTAEEEPMVSDALDSEGDALREELTPDTAPLEQNRRLYNEFKTRAKASAAGGQRTLRLGNIEEFGNVVSTYVDEDYKILRYYIQNLSPPVIGTAARRIWLEIMSAIQGTEIIDSVLRRKPPRPKYKTESGNRKPISIGTSFIPIGDNFQTLLAVIEGPPGSPYQGGLFFIEISVPNSFPNKPPSFKFITRVFHPNISTNGAICMDNLKETWSPIFQIEPCLVMIQSLLDSPDPDDPIVPEIAEQLVTDPEEFDRSARAYTIKYANPENIPDIVKEIRQRELDKLREMPGEEQ